MNLEQDLVFCYIEEDNIQRAYFRVRPLLTIHGDVQQEASTLWPDHACLRIVPDRNEQHTFKDRMRTLGGYCVMNLQGIPADANKIRTNKNYKPERGEHNQYILYSDTVQALPEHTFFEVVESTAEAFAQAAETAVTPLFYIREGDTLYGPVRKAAPEKPSTAGEAAGTLYPLACPDGKERVLLCIPQPAPAVQEPAPAPVREPEPEEKPLPIGKPLQILDQSKDFEQTLQSLDRPVSKGANLLHQPAPKAAVQAAALQDKPLTGTPLYRAPMRTSVPQPKNKLQEVVSAQWRVARNEPPTAPLPAGAKMRQVENPVEVACTAMRKAWEMPEAHTQLIDFLLSLDGMRAKLEPSLTETAGGSPLQKALQARLQDMEADRLATLVQLDKAKADLENLRRNAIESMTEKTKADINRLLAEKAAHEAAMEDLRAQQNALTAQRDELTRRVDELQHSTLPATLAKALADAQLAAPVNGIPLRMNPVSGEHATAEELVTRLTETCAASGVTIDRNHAVALLALLAVCPRIGFTCAAPAAAATLARNIAAGMGWLGSFAQQVSAEQKPLLSARPANATPAVLLTSLPAYAPLDHITKVLLSRNAAGLLRNPPYETCSWPVYPLPELPFIPLATEQTIAPLSLAALSELPAVDPAQIDQVLGGVMKQISPLAGEAMAELQHFVSIGAALMEGGLAAACDWAILLWVLPALEHTPKALAAITPLLKEYPLSLARLQA